MALSVAKAILFCLYASLYLCSTKGITNLRMNVFVSAVLAFGDSFVDQGNNNYITTAGKANFPPYGRDFMGGIPTGRFSNGKTIADFFAEALGVKEYLPAYLDPSLQDHDLWTGVSFASGGTGYDPLTPTITYAIPPADQLEYFKQYIGKLKRKLGEEAANNIITKSVFLIVSSTNDLQISLPIRRFQYDVHAYANMLVKLATNFVQIAGGPLRMCVDNENEAAQVFNGKLKEQLQILARNLPESRVAFVDFYNPLISIIQKSHQYGLEVTDRGCCGTGAIEWTFLCNRFSITCKNDSQFLFWDSTHLSEMGASIFVNHILRDLMNRLF